MYSWHLTPSRTVQYMILVWNSQWKTYHTTTIWQCHRTGYKAMKPIAGTLRRTCGTNGGRMNRFWSLDRAIREYHPKTLCLWDKKINTRSVNTVCVQVLCSCWMIVFVGASFNSECCADWNDMKTWKWTNTETYRMPMYARRWIRFIQNTNSNFKAFRNRLSNGHVR
jgi:hypothetical protein